MTREIQEHAEQMIVHSVHQQDVLRLESSGPPGARRMSFRTASRSRLPSEAVRRTRRGPGS